MTINNEFSDSHDRLLKYKNVFMIFKMNLIFCVLFDACVGSTADGRIILFNLGVFYWLMWF